MPQRRGMNNRASVEKTVKSGHDSPDDDSANAITYMPKTPKEYRYCTVFLTKGFTFPKVPCKNEDIPPTLKDEVMEACNRVGNS